jgi:hypothetical protein
VTLTLSRQIHATTAEVEPAEIKALQPLLDRPRLDRESFFHTPRFGGVACTALDLISRQIGF